MAKPKKTQQVIKESGFPAKVIRSTIRQLGGKGSLEDIMNHGANCGFHGFIYTRELIAFYKRNRKEINAMCQDMAESLGEGSAAQLVANFNGLRDSMEYDRKAHKDDTMREIYLCLSGAPLTRDATVVAPILAQFACEEVARAFCDY